MKYNKKKYSTIFHNRIIEKKNDYLNYFLTIELYWLKLEEIPKAINQ